jgi:BON domain
MNSRPCDKITVAHSWKGHQFVDRPVVPAMPRYREPMERLATKAARAVMSVAVADGKITLEGITTSGSLRRRAEAIAREATGIVVIDNRIHSVPSRGTLR